MLTAGAGVRETLNNAVVVSTPNGTEAIHHAINPAPLSQESSALTLHGKCMTHLSYLSVISAARHLK